MSVLTLSLARNVSWKPERQSLAENLRSDTSAGEPCTFPVPFALLLFSLTGFSGEGEGDTRPQIEGCTGSDVTVAPWVFSVTSDVVCPVVTNYFQSQCCQAAGLQMIVDSEDAQHVMRGSGKTRVLYMCLSEYLHTAGSSPGVTAGIVVLSVPGIGNVPSLHWKHLVSIKPPLTSILFPNPLTELIITLSWHCWLKPCVKRTLL